MAIRIEVNRNDLRRVSNRIKKVGRLPQYVLEGSENFLKQDTRKGIAKQLMIEKRQNRSRAPRGDMKKSIMRARVEKMKSGVRLIIPSRASRLDLGLPKRLNLTGNRRAKEWVQKYYNRDAIRRVRKSSLKSDPYGPKGGLTGFLVVVRHPFINQGFHRARPKLKTHLKKALKKSVGG